MRAIGFLVVLAAQSGTCLAQHVESPASIAASFPRHIDAAVLDRRLLCMQGCGPVQPEHYHSAVNPDLSLIGPDLSQVGAGKASVTAR
jgi:hypothetical protein